jgi:hypothetical protein
MAQHGAAEGALRACATQRVSESAERIFYRLLSLVAASVNVALQPGFISFVENVVSKLTSAVLCNDFYSYFRTSRSKWEWIFQSAATEAPGPPRDPLAILLGGSGGSSSRLPKPLNGSGGSLAGRHR